MIPDETLVEWEADGHFRGGVPHPTDPDQHSRFLANRIVALIAEVRELRITSHQRLGRAWSAALEVMMDARLEDGTPVLSLVFARNPGLAARFDDLMRGAKR